MRLIKNDPNYNEQLAAGRGAVQAHLRHRRAEATCRAGERRQALAAPAGGHAVRPGRHVELLQARELSQRRRCPQGKVTATFAGEQRSRGRGSTPFTSHGNGMPLNWHNQGADAGLYDNDDIHAVRILAMEPTTDRNRGAEVAAGCSTATPASGCAILGEIPVRKFDTDGKQPTRPRRQPGHELPGEDPGRRGLHVPDARQATAWC